eukprot:38530-Amphidinium_carterae.1
MYLDGDAVQQDAEKAFHWMLQAAELGLPDAKLRLSEMYESGTGEQHSSQCIGHCRMQGCKIDETPPCLNDGVPVVALGCWMVSV